MVSLFVLYDLCETFLRETLLRETLQRETLLRETLLRQTLLPETLRPDILQIAYTYYYFKSLSFIITSTTVPPPNPVLPSAPMSSPDPIRESRPPPALLVMPLPIPTMPPPPVLFSLRQTFLQQITDGVSLRSSSNGVERSRRPSREENSLSQTLARALRTRHLRMCDDEEDEDWEIEFA
jgi:hypothetical protein